MADDPTPHSGRLALGLWIALTLVLALAGREWPSDPRLETWIGQIGADAGWQLLDEEFGGDESAALRFESERDLTREQLRWLRVSFGELEREPALRRVVSVFSLPGSEPPATASDLERTAEGSTVQALGLLRRGSARRRVEGILLLDSEAGLQERARLFLALESLRGEARRQDLSLRHAGHPAVAAALDREAKRIERFFAPLLAVLAFVGTALFLRSGRLALLAVLPAVAASSATRAVLKLLGTTSDLILVTVGPLVFVLLLAAVLHLVVTFQRRVATNASAARAAGEALREKFGVALLGALTTAVGFGVFAWSGLRSVALLGGATALAVLVSVPLSYPLTAWFLARTRPARNLRRFESDNRRRRRRRRFLRSLAALSIRRRLVLRIGTIALLAGGAYVGMNLRTETNALHYFPEDSTLKADFLALEAGGTPLSSVDLLLARESAGAGELDELRLSGDLLAVPGVVSVFGPEPVLEDVRARREGAVLGSAAFEEAALLLAERTDAAGRWARWSVRFDTTGAEETGALVREIEASARDRLSRAGWGEHELHVAGSLPRLLEMQARLVGTLGRSLAWTAGASALLFLLFAVKRPRELLAVIVVNLAPVAGILLAARLLRFPLDGATVMVAAVALGLAVDNTFHLLHAATPARPEPRGILPAFERVGEAAAASSVGLALGFSALAFSGFAPTARFGTLCAIGALCALVSDLVGLPAFWVRPTRRGARDLSAPREGS